MLNQGSIMKAPNRQKQACPPSSSKKAFLSAAHGNHFRNLQLSNHQEQVTARFPTPTATMQPLPLRVREHDNRLDGKIVRARGPGFMPEMVIAYPWQENYTS